MSQAIAWTLCSIAIVLTFGRFAIRWQKIQRLQWDDYLNGAALGCLIAFVATYQVYLPVQYELELDSLGLGTDVPSDDQQVFILKVELANELLFWFTVYFVKASFLASYWIIFNVAPGFRKLWWGVTVYTVVTFLIIIPASAWQCGDPAKYADLVQCSLPNYQTNFNIIVYWCVFNVIGDLLIIALPIVMLRRLQISMVHKIGLGFVFFLVAVDIVFDLLRTVYTLDADASSFPDANTVWALCEPTIAVMICALPSYRSLLPKRSKPSPQSYEELHHPQNFKVSGETHKSSVLGAASARSAETQHSVNQGNWEMESFKERSISERV